MKRLKTWAIALCLPAMALTAIASDAVVPEVNPLVNISEHMENGDLGPLMRSLARQWKREQESETKRESQNASK